MARPTAAKAAPKMIDFFICGKTDGMQLSVIQSCSISFVSHIADARVSRRFAPRDRGVGSPEWVYGNQLAPFRVWTGQGLFGLRYWTETQNCAF